MSENERERARRFKSAYLNLSCLTYALVCILLDQIKAFIADDSADGSAGAAAAAADPWLGQRPSLAGHPVVQVRMAPGDVVIAHQKLAHRISFNYSPFIRYQVYFRLGAEGRRPEGEAPLGGLWDNFPGLASVTAAGA